MVCCVCSADETRKFHRSLEQGFHGSLWIVESPTKTYLLATKESVATKVVKQSDLETNTNTAHKPLDMENDSTTSN